MLEAKNIHRKYRDVEVLKGIDLKIDQGEVISIVGASGAGKTTLLQILGTLDQPDRGELIFRGQKIDLKDRSKLVHAAVGRRIANYLIDSAFVTGIYYGLFYWIYSTFVTIYDASELQEWRHILINTGIFIVASLSYYLPLEGIFKRTIGKVLTGTKVVTKTGEEPTFGQIFTRSFGRLVPFEQFSFLSSKPQNGLHDGISNTMVIRTSDTAETLSYEALGNDGLAMFRNKEIGFVFQFHHLLPEFTAIENVCIPAYVNNVSKKEAETRAIELLTDLGLSHRLEHKPSMLSGGEQQRVAVARALINNPSMILADEPSGNLDSSSAKELHALFFKLREKYNQTFIIVTHNDELADMADRKLVMKDGVITN